MRTEHEMFALILNFAQQDERIRAAWMNGSRANPTTIADKYQDFDFVFAVTEMDSFLADDDWLEAFGERLIMQKPEAMTLFPPVDDGTFAYLMLFSDGNRIDLTLVPFDMMEQSLASDRMCVLLLDKDDLVPVLPPPTDEVFWLKRPACTLFDECCNEFWWLSGYVAKALARDQLPYANAHLDLMRTEVMRMLSWQAGLDGGFSINFGKDYKYLQNFVSEEDWAQLMLTWKMDSSDHIWESLFALCQLFVKLTPEVASKLGCLQPDYDRSVMPYLCQIRRESASLQS
jgi:aminoglycoside 6-adenylyltransferase